MKEEIKKPLAVISGGTGYIGSAIALEFDRRGWRVAILSRTEQSQSKFPTYTCDIVDELQVEKTINTIVSSHGVIRACIHAAATPLDRKAILATPLTSFTASVDTALRGGFLLVKATTPHMGSDSSFIGITTEALDQTQAQKMGAYVTAKYALRGLLRVLAGELANKGVRVYAVAPGFLPGGLNGDLPEPIIEFIKRKSAVVQTPEDVAILIGDICEDPKTFPSGISVTVLPRTMTPL